MCFHFSPLATSVMVCNYSILRHISSIKTQQSGYFWFPQFNSHLKVLPKTINGSQCSHCDHKLRIRLTKRIFVIDIYCSDMLFRLRQPKSMHLCMRTMMTMISDGFLTLANNQIRISTQLSSSLLTAATHSKSWIMDDATQCVWQFSFATQHTAMLQTVHVDW